MLTINYLVNFTSVIIFDEMDLALVGGAAAVDAAVASQTGAQRSQGGADGAAGVGVGGVLRPACELSSTLIRLL